MSTMTNDILVSIMVHIDLVSPDVLVKFLTESDIKPADIDMAYDKQDTRKIHYIAARYILWYMEDYKPSSKKRKLSIPNRSGLLDMSRRVIEEYERGNHPHADI